MRRALYALQAEIRRRRAFRELRRRRVKVDARSHLGACTAIGEGTNINGPAYIASTRKAPVSIGKYCAIAHNLRIRPRNHYTGYLNLQDDFQNRFALPCLDAVKGPVSIGNNVWIGDNVTILSGVTVGDGAAIGAGSVVTRDVPGYCIAVGNPARVVRKRFSDPIIAQLSSIRWWDWPEDRIRRNRRLFETDLARAPDTDLNELIVD
jgi:virginiamycin A acetyltransferase